MKINSRIKTAFTIATVRIWLELPTRHDETFNVHLAKFIAFQLDIGTVDHDDFDSELTDEDVLKVIAHMRLILAGNRIKGYNGTRRWRFGLADIVDAYEGYRQMYQNRTTGDTILDGKMWRKRRTSTTDEPIKYERRQ